LESINEETLQTLVSEKVAEGKTIEYKQVLPGNSDSEKKEFLADVSSFANAVGGDLMFGIREEGGLAVEVLGVQMADPDSEVLRLESMIRDGIQPRIPAVSSRAIHLQSGAYVVVIRIVKSWAAPHLVAFQNYSRFYSRNSAGKYQLDVGEIRTAFALSESLSERFRNFRLDRLGKLVSNETPIPLEKNAKILLHLIPLSAFDRSTQYDLAAAVKDVTRLFPIYSSSIHGNHYNFDGYLTYSQFAKSSSAHSYLQIFRNGIIEAAEAFMIRDQDGNRLIPSQAFEKELVAALPRLLQIQKMLGVQPPILVMLSFQGVSGSVMAVDRSRFMFEEAHPVDRDALILPEIMLESFECDASQVLKPLFDLVWNAAGWPRSMNYDKNGKWSLS
jgi:hypothetical protein